MAKLDINILGVHFPNPFCLSSSPVGNDYEMCAKAYKAGFGGIVFKTIGPRDYFIDEVSPRFDAVSKEGTPFTGFKNMEQIAEHPYDFNIECIRRLKKDFPDKVLIASIMGNDEESWEYIARDVTEAGADMIELNFSCPQMTSHAMGSDVGTNPELCKKYCEAVKRGTNLPIIAKMTPNIAEMNSVARASVEGGADAIAAINTLKSITAVDLDKLISLPIIDGKSAVSGYSGAAVKPIGLRFVSDLARDEKLKGVPISGIGGIETWSDAAEYILLGASFLQITTAVMQYGYRIVEDLIDGLSRYMDRKGFASLEEMVGLAARNIIPAENLNRDYKVYPHIDEKKCVKCLRCVESCYDGAHQALSYDEDERLPILDKEKCVGCHLCKLVCPVGAISAGEISYKPGRKKGEPFI